MNSFAHPMSIPVRRDQTAAPSVSTAIVAVLVVLALTALASIAFTMHSLSSQLETTQAAQVAATEQAAASGAYAACVGNHGAGAAAKCRAAASTFAFGDSGTEPAAFDRAVAFIYPQKR